MRAPRPDLAQEVDRSGGVDRGCRGGGQCGGAGRGSGPSHGRSANSEASTRQPISIAISDSPRVAADTATKYLGLLADSAVGSPADVRDRVTAMTTGPLRAELEQGLPVLTRALRVRLASADAPAAFEGWPLGYKVTSFSENRAVVSVWHLDLAATSTLRLMTTDYATSTYEVRWRAGSWRIDRASTVAGPTPPPPGAPPAAVDRFAKAIEAFSRYRYAP